MPNTDPDPIWIQGFDDQKLKKITVEKCGKMWDFLGSKNAIYFSLVLHKSLKRTSSSPNKKLTFPIIVGYCLPVRIH
jgi:hypothetical protein